MNKKYKSAFSHICPSEKSVERIFDMTEKKKIKLRPLLVAAAIVALLAVSVVSANAATDGAVVEDVIEAVNFLKNGKEKAPEDFNYEHSKETVNGEDADCYSFDITKINGENCRYDLLNFANNRFILECEGKYTVESGGLGSSELTFVDEEDGSIHKSVIEISRVDEKIKTEIVEDDEKFEIYIPYTVVQSD